MSHELHLILNVAVAVAIALVGGLLAHRLRQPTIVGYLLAGVAIGPFTPGFSGDRPQIAALAEVGVVFLMFALGIEFSLKELAAVKRVALLGTAAQVLLTLAAGAALGLVVGWGPLQSAFFGGVIAISSTMVILKTLIDRGEVTSNHGRVLLGMLVVQDLVVVVLIVLLPKLAGESAAALPDLAWALVKAVAFIGATLALGAGVVPRLMAHVERLHSPELFVLTAVALALGTASVSAILGLSPALGAFMAGLMLTETEFDHRVIAELVPMRDLFATLFFVSIGMLIDPLFIAGHLGAVLGLAAFIMVAKAIVTLFVLLPFRLGGKTTAFTALGMIQIGEFSYVLASAGQEVGAISTELNNLILAASVVSIICTPAAFWIAPRVDLFLARLPLLGRLLAAPVATTVVDHPLAEHAIVVGYGRVGRRVVEGLQQAGLPLAVVEQDLRLVQELAAEGVSALYGDASYASVLAAAQPGRARLIVVALPDSGATRATVLNARRANPTAPILARAARPDDDAALRRAGATAVILPELAGALVLLEESLLAIGLPATPAADELHAAVTRG